MNKTLLITAGIALAVSGMSFMTPEGLLGIEGIKNSSGAAAGHTGSPGDGKDCTFCHGGTASARADMITSDIPAGGYVPGSTYTITAMVSEAGRTKFGFQVSPQNNSGSVLGFMNGNNDVQLVGGGNYATHRFGSTSGTDSKSWTFDWTAPTAGTGDVTFYGAFNAANNNGSSSGDVIYTSSLTVSEDPGNSIAQEQKNELKAYPNPSNGTFRVEFPTAIVGTAQILVTDMSGKQVRSRTVSGQELAQSITLDLSNEPKGIYLVQLVTEQITATTKVALQ